MSIQIAQLQLQSGVVLINQYLEKLEDVDCNYHNEWNAAVTVQRFYRGLKCRLRLRRLINAIVILQAASRGFLARQHRRLAIAQEQKTQEINRLNGFAVRIQKVWHGYISRKKIFDYYGRKRQLGLTEQKNREVLQQLEEYQITQRLLEGEAEKQRQHLLLEKQAANRHHLLGTKNIQGVFGSVPKFPYKRKEAAVVQNDQERNRRHELERKRLGANIQLTETDLRQSASLKQWTRDFKLNSMKKALLLARPESPPQEHKKKLAEGPFLPMYKLDLIKNNPGKPTLRVQTEYADGSSKRFAYEPASKIHSPDKSASPKSQRKLKLPELNEQSFITRGPFGSIEYGTKTFREEDKARRIIENDFVTRVKGVDYFD